MPDTLNYRVGPHVGWGALYVPDAPNSRQGPQARKPSKCLEGQICGERGLLIASYKRLKKKKKTLIGP